METQLLFDDAIPPFFAESMANRLKPSTIAQILVLRERFGREKKVMGACFVRELIRNIFKVTISNKKRLSRAISQACNEPETISPKLMEESEKLMPYYRKMVSEFLEESNKKEASHE